MNVIVVGQKGNKKVWDESEREKVNGVKKRRTIKKGRSRLGLQDTG